MSVTCPDCGAVAGYGQEIGHKIGCPSAGDPWRRTRDLPPVGAVMTQDPLLQALTRFSDFINEPPQYEDRRMVRDYRHELARKWIPLLEMVQAALAAPQPEPNGDPEIPDGDWPNIHDDEGIDFALLQLCAFLGVDPASVSWDAATETRDGDVLAVIGNILRAKFGEDWGPNAPQPAPLVLEESEALDGTIMQTVRHADGSEEVRPQPAPLGRIQETVRQFRDCWHDAISETWQRAAEHPNHDGSDLNLNGFDAVCDAILAGTPALDDPLYMFGLDYGKDLLKDINQLAHTAGTSALHRDLLQRAYREIKRLASTPAPSVDSFSDMLWKWFDDRDVELRQERRDGLTADDFRTMLDEHEAALETPSVDRAAVIEACAKVPERKTNMAGSEHDWNRGYSIGRLNAATEIRALAATEGKR